MSPMQKVYALDSVWRARVQYAYENGAYQTGHNSLFWDISRKCEKPVIRTMTARRVQDPSFYREDIDIRVPCRKCPTCLRLRAWQWQQRAKREMFFAERTWFCTYTIRPSQRFLFKLMAKDDRSLSEARVIGKEFTKYLKRIRKESGAKLRYVLVFEHHKDGYPHLHALIHEVSGKVVKRTLQDQWPHGFSTVKLADLGSCEYVTKYLTKSNEARVRASLHYGERSLIIDKKRTRKGAIF